MCTCYFHIYIYFTNYDQPVKRTIGRSILRYFDHIRSHIYAYTFENARSQFFWASGVTFRLHGFDFFSCNGNTLLKEKQFFFSLYDFQRQDPVFDLPTVYCFLNKWFVRFMVGTDIFNDRHHVNFLLLASKMQPARPFWTNLAIVLES